MKKYKVTFRDGSSVIVDAQTLKLNSLEPDVFVVSSSTPSFLGIEAYMKSNRLRSIYVVFNNKYASKARQLVNEAPTSVNKILINKELEVNGYKYDGYYKLTLV